MVQSGHRIKKTITSLGHYQPKTHFAAQESAIQEIEARCGQSRHRFQYD